MPVPKQKKRRISDDLVRETLLARCVEQGTSGSVRPETIAQEIYPEAWQTLLKRIRLMAKQLALKGDIVILRKGQPTDPHDFKGIIHLQVTPAYLQALAEAEAEAETNALDV